MRFNQATTGNPEFQCLWKEKMIGLGETMGILMTALTRIEEVDKGRDLENE